MTNFYEKDLVSKLDNILKREFGTNLAFHEFSAGYGIADLVFAPEFSFDKKNIKRTPITDFNSLTILLTLSRKLTYGFNEITEVFPYFSQKEIKKSLRNLLIGGYIEKVNKHYYRKIPTTNRLNPINKIVAIEVKLKDHRKGLVQARRYQYFADSSYLAILKEAENNIDIAEFNRYNIGLILFDKNKERIEIRHPQPNNQHYQQRVSLFAKEMMLSKFMSFAS